MSGGGISLAAALLVNLTGAAGVALVVAAAPRFQRPSLHARLDPFQPGHRPGTPGRRYRSDGSPRGGLLWPAAERAAALAERWLGGPEVTARRLRAAGLEADPVAFRAEQLLWGLTGFILGVVAGAAAGHGGASPATVVLPVAGAVTGALARDWWLGRAIARRQARMLAEFPALVDLLCLAVTAGESPVAALRRVVRGAGGALRDEFATVLEQMEAGRSFVGACEQLAVRVQLPEVRRFADALVIAVDRGTPLADVLRAQAADVRERRKRQLIESGSRREVYMLVPVVALILPVIVLFVLYPGLLLVRAW